MSALSSAVNKTVIIIGTVSNVFCFITVHPFPIEVWIEADIISITWLVLIGVYLEHAHCTIVGRC